MTIAGVEIAKAKLADEILIKEQQTSANNQLNLPLKRTLQVLLISILLISPIFFGAVHPTIYLVLEIACFSFFAAACVYQLSSKQALFSLDSELIKLSLIAILGFVAYFSLQSISFLFSPRSLLPSHPVVGNLAQAVNLNLIISTLRGALALLAFILCTFTYLNNVTGSAKFLSKLLILSGFSVSLIALSHWFYDTGKLFWYFEPNYIFNSDRARWPFVSSNSLAQFLLPILFLNIGELLQKISTRKTQPLPTINEFSAQVTKTSFQKEALNYLALGLSLITILLALSATLSRAAWLGTSLGIFLLISIRALQKNAPDQQKNQTPRKIFKSRKELLAAIAKNQSAQASNQALPKISILKSRVKDSNKNRSINTAMTSTKWLKNMLTPLLILSTGLLFILLLGGKGGEMVANRVEYGLAYSKDDIRFTMYKDTIKMISDHPIFGVGLGNWAQLYPQYSSDELAGLNPVYLHSDLLQIVPEGGIIAGLGLLAFIYLFFFYTLKSIKDKNEDYYRILGLSCGFAGFLVCCALDFPMRIPSICYMIAAIYTLTAFYIFNGSKKT